MDLFLPMSSQMYLCKEPEEVATATSRGALPVTFDNLWTPSSHSLNFLQSMP